MRLGVVGVGTTGSHVVRQLASADVDLLEVLDRDQERADLVARAVPYLPVVARRSRTELQARTVVLATPSGTHPELAGALVRAGRNVVSLSDDVADVEGLLALDDAARAAGVSVTAGAGFNPGLACILVRHAVDQMDSVEEIRVASAGTGGPACARRHHQALNADALEWFGGEPQRRRGGTGRELSWFPEPIGALDCYRASVATPTLLHRRYPDVDRITARYAATRRDRLTSWLPMLRPPHIDGGPGAVRVEVRGVQQGRVTALIYAVMDHPSVGAAMVAAVVACRAGRGELPPGCHGLAEVIEPVQALDELAQRGLRAAAFDGTSPR